MAMKAEGMVTVWRVSVRHQKELCINMIDPANVWPVDRDVDPSPSFSIFLSKKDSSLAFLPRSSLMWLTIPHLTLHPPSDEFALVFCWFSQCFRTLPVILNFLLPFSKGSVKTDFPYLYHRTVIMCTGFVNVFINECFYWQQFIWGRNTVENNERIGQRQTQMVSFNRSLPK